MSEAFIDMGPAGWHGTLYREDGVPVRIGFWQCPGLPDCPVCFEKAEYERLTTRTLIADPAWDAMTSQISSASSREESPSGDAHPTSPDSLAADGLVTHTSRPAIDVTIMTPGRGVCSAPTQGGHHG